MSLPRRPSEGGRRGPSLRTKRHEMTAEVVASVDIAVRYGRGGYYQTEEAVDGCVATAASERRHGACLQAVAGKILQRCHVATEPLRFSRNAAGTTVDIHTSSCTPLVQLNSDLHVPNHSLDRHETVCPPFACQSRATHFATAFFHWLRYLKIPVFGTLFHKFLRSFPPVFTGAKRVDIPQIATMSPL